MNDFLDVLSKLEHEIRESKKTVLGGSRYIDEATCMDYIFVLKNMIPNEIKEAKLLLSEREEIIANAKSESESIINNAYEEMNRILDSSEIIGRANHEANMIVSRAEQFVETIKHEASGNINDLMINAEDKIIHVLNVIRDCQSDLRKTGFED